MDVLIVEPEKEPRLAKISGSLESLQKIVGGIIEAVYSYDDPIALLCHDEGKLIGLPLNRRINNFDIIAGTFLICGLGEEDFCSLTPELAEKYKHKFAEPEMFMRVGNKIVGIPKKYRDELILPKEKHKPHDLDR